MKRKGVPSLTLTALQQARHPPNPTPRHSGVSGGLLAPPPPLPTLDVVDYAPMV